MQTSNRNLAATPRPATLMTLLTIGWIALAMPTVLGQPEWIWSRPHGQALANEVVHFRRSFELDSKPTKANLFASCDNQLDIWINGQSIGGSSEWQTPIRTDVAKHLRASKNIIAIRGENDGGNLAGLVVRLELEFAGGDKQFVDSNPTWKQSNEAPEAWKEIAFNDASWAAAVSEGKLGVSPWGNLSGGRAPGRPNQATPAEDLNVLDGFQVELIYNVPKAEQGSWVALTKDAHGRLIASDQGSRGLYRIQVSRGTAEEPTSATVERIDVDLSGAQGLAWAFDSLYVHVSGRGLYRVTDRNGDDQLDTVQDLGGANGGGEHGNHAVNLTEDGQGLYVDAGNHTDLPKDITASRISMNWGEDLLLPRQWDARGHARGRLAPGGWIARISPDASEWEVFSIGYRNQYDIAINRHGDLFTFDADMEWDLGMPWYRPTRICHATSGSEFGWRSGTGKWPVYYEDSLPATVDIGPGSPTGTVFGTGTQFPHRYQDALYALDWTFGTIWAIHLTPEGASYSATKQEFISGSPLPVTDAIVGNDGALYFTVGGRDTQSGLYRVTYTGSEPTTPADAPLPESVQEVRTLRHQLEQYHGRTHPDAVETAWPLLGTGDRFLRYAARIAIESQPVSQWRHLALGEPEPLARAVAAIALARTGTETRSTPILESLLRQDLNALNEPALLATLRAYALTFVRIGPPNPEVRKRILAALDPLLPSENDDVNAELVRLMVFLDGPSIVEKALPLMLSDRPQAIPDWGQYISRNQGYGGTVQRMLDSPPPTRQLNYAFMLRNVRYGWTLDQRRAYFQFLNEAAKHPGGASYAGFLENIRSEALANCSDAERATLTDLTGESLQPPPPVSVAPPKGPGREWTVESAYQVVDGQLQARDFENGQNLFYATACAACHRFDGQGGAIGPDLTSVRNKFSVAELIESIIEPSRVISDQYGTSIVELRNGRQLEGLVVESERNGQPALVIYSRDPIADPAIVPKQEVASTKQSPVSQMQTGLVNALNPEELRDLVAYLLSRGNPEDPMFQN